MNLRCKDCKVTFYSPYNKDCPFCGSDAFDVELLHENKETEPDYWMIRREIWSDDIEKLQEQLNTTKKYIEHVIGTIKHDGHLGTIQTDWILPDLEKALAAIGGDDE